MKRLGGMSIATWQEGVGSARDRDGIIPLFRGGRSQSVMSCARRYLGHISLHALSHLPPRVTLRTRSRLCLKEHLGEVHAPRRPYTRPRQMIMGTAQHLATNRATESASSTDEAKPLTSVTEDDTRKWKCRLSMTLSSLFYVSHRKRFQDERIVAKRFPGMAVDFVNHSETY